MDDIVLIIDNNQDRIEINDALENVIRGAAIAVLENQQFSKQVEISVTLVDNVQIQEINNQHRNKDVPTDVLSFPMLTFDKNNAIIKDDTLGDYNYDEDVLLLGDIVISLERAKAQAQEFGHTFEREVGFLVVHSMLHLLGHDHEIPKEQKVMREKEEQVLEKIGLKR